MKTGLKFINSKKIINGTTTIVFEEAVVDLSCIRAFSVIKSIPFMSEVMNEFPSYYEGKLVLRGKGVAKCHKDDQYNADKGFYIAHSRACMDIMGKYDKFMAFVSDAMNKYFINDFTELWSKVSDSLYAINDHIEYDLINNNK